MKKIEYRDRKYKKILVDKIKKINNISLKEICKDLNVSSYNVRVDGMSIEKLDMVYDTYVNTLLKELILSQSDISYERKIYYGGRDVKH